MYEADDRPVLGIDIGGTKMAAGVVTPAGLVRGYRRRPTDHSWDADGLLAAIVALAGEAVRASGLAPAAIGVGCGGPMRYPDGVVSPLHIPAWRDFPLASRLMAAFALPVSVDNDAKALALGEARFGAGRGARNLLGMVVSTGIGGGIVTDGRLYHGASGNAGHIGHVIVAAGGPRCECGARGCVTVYASGTGMAGRASAALARGVSSELAALPGGDVTAETIAGAARAGDPLALRLYREAGQALARAIASAAALLDLDRVVLGGGVSLAGELLMAPLRREWQRCATLPFTRQLTIAPAELGGESGVIGAAALARTAGGAGPVATR
jgi:glucokinase